MTFNKNMIQDTELLVDIKREAWDYTVIKRLRKLKITTYTQLFSLLRDEHANPQLRADICEEIGRLFRWIDKRRFVPPLLDILKTTHESVLNNAIKALGNLESKRAIAPISSLAGDKARSYETRYAAIMALVEGIGDKEAIPVLSRIMLDGSDDIKIREDAIEQTAWLSDPSLVNIYTQLLADPEPDMRFWAAYGFAIMQMWTDISNALRELDSAAAYDHTAPAHWWHIDREALNALENIYWFKLDLDTTHSKQQVHIISPAPEYTTFQWRYNNWEDDLREKIRPPIMKVDVDWLTEKLTENWPQATLNIRSPKPQTYLVDWCIEIDDELLIGGLHRDQYTVVITGNRKAVHFFTAWYRTIIDPKEFLFLYEWAMLAVEIKVGMNSRDVENAERERWSEKNAINERGIEYPWVIETD